MAIVRDMIREGKFEEAIAVLEQNMQRYPGNSTSWWNLGKVYAQASRFAQAEAAYTKSLELAAKEWAHVPAYYRGCNRHYQGKYVPALADFHASSNFGFDEYFEPDIFWSQAQTYEALNWIGHAITSYGFYKECARPAAFNADREIERLKTWKQTKFVYTLSWAGIQPVAEPEEKMDLSPTQKVAQESIPLYRLGKYQEAIALFKDLTEREPANDRAWRYLGHAHWYTGEEVPAIQAFQMAYHLGPQQAENRFCQGCMQYMQRQYDRALEELNQAEGLGLPNHDLPRLYQFRGDTYQKLGNLDAAIQDYQAYDTYTGRYGYQGTISWLRSLKRKQ